MPRQSIFNMSLSKIYPMLVQKAERKNHTQTELETQLSKDITYQTFFEEAPQMNPNCNLITGVVCGVRVEAIEDPLMQKIRWLDKLVDELAKGKTMEKILRE